MLSPGLLLHLSPVMEEEDWEIIDELSRACQATERADTFYPLFRNCAICHGFIFGQTITSDVKAQLGVCGCVVALEMEMRATGLTLAAPSLKATALAKRKDSMQAKSKLMNALFGPEHGCVRQQPRKTLLHARMRYHCSSVSHHEPLSFPAGDTPRDVLPS